MNKTLWPFESQSVRGLVHKPRSITESSHVATDLSAPSLHLKTPSVILCFSPSAFRTKIVRTIQFIIDTVLSFLHY